MPPVPFLVSFLVLSLVLLRAALHDLARVLGPVHAPAFVKAPIVYAVTPLLDSG